MGKPNDLVQGTLDLLILKTVSLNAMHGWAIAKRIQQISGEVLQVQQGSLYPALHRLERARPAAKPSFTRLPPPDRASWKRKPPIGRGSPQRSTLS
jgi:hypothetical protein